MAILLTKTKQWRKKFLSCCSWRWWRCQQLECEWKCEVFVNSKV